MKKVLSLLLAAMMLFGTVVSAPVLLFAAVDDYDFQEITKGELAGTMSITGFHGTIVGTDPTVLPDLYNEKSVTQIGVAAFSQSAVVEVVFPSTIKKVDWSAFSGCENLSFVTLNEGLETIAMFSFSHCYNLGSIALPSTLKTLGQDVFLDTPYLSEITVADDNEYFTSDDGVLFNKDQTVLLKYPQNKPDTDYAVPDTVKTISANAFNGASRLQTVRLYEGLETIEEDAFYGCSKLQNAVFYSDGGTFGSVTVESGNDLLTQATLQTICTGEHVWDDGTESPAPTCGKDGSMLYTCTICGETKTEVIPATGNHSYNTGVVESPPTCSEPGVKRITCTVCGNNYTEAISPTGVHNYDNGVVTKEATCGEPGVMTYTCKECHQDSYTEPIPARGDHTEATREENVTEATCGKAGSKDVVTYCSVCQQELGRETVEIPATGNHTQATKEENVVAATCSKAGSKDVVTYCSVCSKELGRKTVSIPATGHTVVKDKAVKATYFRAGKTAGSHCSVCGKVLVKQKKIAKKIVPTPKDFSVSAGSGLLKTKWSNVSGVRGYRIQVSTSKTFKKGTIVKDVIVIGADRTQRTLKKLTAGKTYYVRVRAHVKSKKGRVAVSKWTKVKKVKVK